MGCGVVGVQVCVCMGVCVCALSFIYFLTRSAVQDDCLIALDQNPTPNVIICDVHMPTGSGLRLTSELEKRNLNIPHIFLTGMIDKLPPQKNAHMLRKPAPMEVLIGKIKQIAQI